MASPKGTESSSGKPAGFMSEYMTGLSQSQDLNSFLQKNQPAYDPKSHSTQSSAADLAAATATATTPLKTRTTPPTTTTSGTSTPTGATGVPPLDSSETSSDSNSSESATPNRPTTTRVAGSHPLPDAHSVFQKHAIQKAALDNCADVNIELTDCLLGRSGTWWDRASMCMKAKQQLQECCRLNREILQQRGYAKKGNTPEQDQSILDYADEHAQQAMKDKKA